MATDSRKRALWLIAVLFAAVLVGWAVITHQGDAAQAARSMGAPPAAAANPPALAASATVALADAAPACRESPLLARKADDDGQERLQAKPAGAGADEVASLIRTGKEAAASGRQRDAEVSFLNACRNAALLQGDEAIALPDAMYQLARLYANAAALGAKPAQQLFERAERLYEASLTAYTGRYGPAHEKTKFAQQGLATVRIATGHTAQPATAKAPPPQPAPAAVAPGAPASAPAVEPLQEVKASEPVKKAEAKSAETKPTEAKPAETKPAETKQAEAKPRAPRPAAQKRETVKPPPEEQQAEPAPPPAEPKPRREAQRAAPPPEPMAIESPAAEPPPPPAASMGAPAGEPTPAEGSATAPDVQ